MGRSALGILFAVAAGSALLGFGLATALRSPTAASDPAGAAAPPARRLREENERLRAELEEARAARAATAPRPAETPAAAPGPAAARPAPSPAPAPLPLPLDPASQVKACLDGLRGACAAGDAALAEKFRLLLVGLGGISCSPLADIAASSSEPEALRLQALLGLQGFRAPGLGAVIAAILRDPASGATLRAAALAAAPAAPADPALEDVARGMVHDPAVSPADRWVALGILAASSIDEAMPLIRRMLDGQDATERQAAIQAMVASRNRAFLPILTEIVNSSTRPSNLHQILGAIAQLKDRPWSALQMTGEPDTPEGGDLGTAWAAKGQEMGDVWVELDYERAVVPAAVRIRETLCPGGVARVLARGPDGSWVTLWEGTADAASPPRWFEPPLTGSAVAASTIRLVLDTDRVQGWEEIDAVELVGGGEAQWAKAARSSSSYADPQ